MLLLRNTLTLLSTLRAIKVVTGEAAGPGLADPAVQQFFTTPVPNPLDPSFIFDTSTGIIQVSVSNDVADTGLKDADGNNLATPIWGFGTDELGWTWPGRTFLVRSGETLHVHWLNKIPIDQGYLLTGKDNTALGLGDYTGQSVVDESFHWAYSIPGYLDYSIEVDGTPICPHLHGAHSDAPFDGNPEYFFTPDFGVRGPQWTREVYEYGNDQQAAALWYHDHALGITRLNVHAGMAGFYIIRDDQDTGKPDNPLGLPAFPYEIPLVVQDRMFKDNGELFYPSFEGDPFYNDFITEEGAQIGDDDPTALAEFFGDFMTVNGKVWPNMVVEPRKYRLRLLNGCDSRFLALRLVASAGEVIPFIAIGGDQGLATSPTTVSTLLVEPGSRYDVIVDFNGLDGESIIMMNYGGDEPFGGDIPGPKGFEFTDQIMAFDVFAAIDTSTPDDVDFSLPVETNTEEVVVNKRRRVALFEGHDQFGRLLPLLGTVDPAVDMDGNPINWPDTATYRDVGLVGQIQGAVPWHAPTTENPKLGDVEEWEIWNGSADAHPVHLHLVQFEVVRRQYIKWDSNVNEDGEIEFHEGMTEFGDGSYTVDRVLVNHDGSIGEGYMFQNPTYGDDVDLTTLPEYVTNFPNDMVTALPGQITTIRAKFDKPGRFVWHCHILAHEDHEMMRVFHVGPLPDDESPIDESPSDEEEEEEESSSSNAKAIGIGVGVGTFAFLLSITALIVISKKQNQHNAVPALPDTKTPVKEVPDASEESEEEIIAGLVAEESNQELGC